MLVSGHKISTGSTLGPWGTPFDVPLILSSDCYLGHCASSSPLLWSPKALWLCSWDMIRIRILPCLEIFHNQQEIRGIILMGKFSLTCEQINRNQIPLEETVDIHCRSKVVFLRETEFSASLLQSSVSHDPSEIILLCWSMLSAETVVLLHIVFLEHVILFSLILWWIQS